jgi:hypothetical protein
MFRYFDGAVWTAHTAATPAGTPTWGAPPVGRAPTTASRAPFVAGGVILAVAVVAIVAFAITRPNSVPDAAVARVVTGTTPRPAYEPPRDENGVPKAVPVTLPVAVDAPRASLPAALYAVPAGSDVVTPDSARATANALWELRRDAIAAGSRKALATFETGSALAVDAGRGCGCGVSDHFGPIARMNLAVPHAPEFPAWFVADIDTTLNDRAWGAELVFTRASAEQPWRVALAGGGEPLQPGAMFEFATGPDGFVLRPSPAVKSQGEQLAPRLADYYQAAKDGRFADGELWEPGGLTDQWAAQLAQNRQGRVHEHNRLQGWYRYAVEPGTQTYVVPLADGGNLACAAIRGQSTFTGPTGVLQTPARDNWGPDLAPGVYRAVTIFDEYVPCFWFSPAYPKVVVNGATPPDDFLTIGVR